MVLVEMVDTFTDVFQADVDSQELAQWFAMAQAL
jgi:hypothetical protein